MANVVGKQLEWGTKDIATPTFSPQLAQFGYDFFYDVSNVVNLYTVSFDVNISNSLH